MSYVFHQLTDDRKPVGTVFKDIQNTEKNISNAKFIPCSAETAVDAVDIADTTMTQLDPINSVYLQPLSTFNKVVNGTASICSFNRSSILANNHA